MTFYHLRRVAILDVEVTSKRENNHFRGFAMQHFVKYDRVICTSSSSDSRDIAFYVFVNGIGGHFGNRALAELAGIFKNVIGVHFSLKGFR